MQMTGFLLIIFAEIESVIGEKFYDEMIWEMPVIKNLTIIERIKELETKLEKEGFFGKEKYKEAYEKEVAAGKKPFTLVDLSSLTKYIDKIKVPDEEGIEAKLKHRQTQWYLDEFKKWKKLCHANFGLLEKKKQAEVVEFCPKADRCFIPKTTQHKYPHGERTEEYGQPKTPEKPIQILKGEIAHIDCVRYQCECPDYHENGFPVGKEVRGEIEYQVAEKELGYSQCWLFARRLGWRFQDCFWRFLRNKPIGRL